MKKTLLISLLLILSLALFACGGGESACETCIDDNGDGFCDVCDTEMPKGEVQDVVLIEDGVANFQIVVAKTAPTKIRNFVNSKLAGVLRNRFDVDVTVVVEDSDNDKLSDTELLIGDVKNRGAEYEYDKYSLGSKGYVIQIVGGKIIINGAEPISVI